MTKRCPHSYKDLSTRQRQRGAALIVVLLLAATLSFIALALVGAVSRSAQRTAGATIRSELLWRAVSAEAIAIAAIEQALDGVQRGGPPLTLEHPLFSQQLDIPFDGGGGAIIFADATRCFNLNSLVSIEGDGGKNEDAAAELAGVLQGIGLGQGDAEKLTSVVVDWIDSDTIQEIGGAEDNFYTNLPTPFRTGGGDLASVSELRAMLGVTDELYNAVSPLLCAHPNRNPVTININALRPVDAPLLVGLTDGAIDMATAENIISNRPPGGWSRTADFWEQPVFDSLNDAESGAEAPIGRTSVSSQFIEAQAGATVNEIDMNIRLLFMTSESGGNVTLVKRELGTSQ
ncbi:MAG: type II secretion system minor pseudopilin GspK [Pseudomonadota bacterium]